MRSEPKGNSGGEKINILLKKLTTSLTVPVIFLATAAAGAGPDNATNNIELSGGQLLDCTVALAEFQSRNYKVKNFREIVIDRPAGHEIIFYRNAPKDVPSVRGGANIFGKEIHYLVSNSGKIEKISFGR